MLRINPKPAAVQLVKKFTAAGKNVAAMCHGPWLLIEAEVVRGREVTFYPPIRTDLKNSVPMSWTKRSPLIKAS